MARCESALNYPLCRGEGCQATTLLIRSGLSPRNATSPSGHFLWVTFLLLRASCPPPFGPASPFARAPARAWASKRKVTRPSAEGRNARCVSGQIAGTFEAEGQEQSHWTPAYAGVTALLK